MGKNVSIIAGGQVQDLSIFVKENVKERFVVGVDGGALALMKEGISIDLAIGDFDSVTGEEFHELQNYAKRIEKLPAEKDLTDTEAALQFLIDEQMEIDQIQLIGLFGGRVDHLMSNIWLAFQPAFSAIVEKMILVDADNELSFYHPGEYEIQKDSTKKYLSFIGMTAIENLVLKNVKYTLEGADFTYPVALVSNEFLTDQMTFSFDKGLLAVIQSRDSKKRS